MAEALWKKESRHLYGDEVFTGKAHPFAVRGRHFLFVPEDMRLYYCSREEWRELSEGEVKFRKPVFSKHEPRVRMLVFNMTHQCNLRCAYCFHDGINKKVSGADSDVVADNENPEKNSDRVVSLETAEKALTLLDKSESFSVGFFGGEPLLYKERVREIVCLAKSEAVKAGVRAKFSLTTNATLLDIETVRFLSEEKFSLIVSLDGPQELHDSMRKNANGLGSYAEVMEGLQIISQFSGLANRTTLRATYAASQARLLPRVKHLNAVCRRFGFGNVSVEAADVGEGCANGGAEKVDAGPALRREYLDTAEWFAEEIIKGRKPKLHHFDMRIRRLSDRIPAATECGAGRGYITVTPDGSLFACHREGDCRVGDVENGIDREKQEKWLDNNLHSRQECPDCVLRYVCGGGCRLNSIHNTGDIRKPDPLGCRLTQICFECAALIMSKTGGRG